MTSVDAEDEIVRRVLESFQCELRRIRGGWFWRIFMGDAPTEWYAQQMSELDARGRMTGSVFDVWRITHTEIVALSAAFTVPRPTGRSGMYFDRGSFDFVVAPDHTSVVVGWQIGPRFGRGFRYQVVTGDDGHLSLGLADTLWIS